jgi:redox-sensitive bicupin YhaK (pirin superfamily)
MATTTRTTKHFKVRESLDRGYANHGWLSTYHTFSFADYDDPQFNGWSSLRVLNEDRVMPGRVRPQTSIRSFIIQPNLTHLIVVQGFGAHPHQNYEIFSYVISGSIEHRDSLGNCEVISGGGVQFTSAGSGVRHSEYNHSKTESLHFLQLWVKPNRSGHDPSYQTVHFTEEEKRGRLCLIVAPKDELAKQPHDEATKAPVAINQDVKVYASLLAKDEQVTHNIGEGRCGYLHVCETGGQLRLRDSGNDEEVVLGPGDGAFIKEGTQLQLIGANHDDKRVEFLLLDLTNTNAQW